MQVISCIVHNEKVLFPMKKKEITEKKKIDIKIVLESLGIIVPLYLLDKYIEIQMPFAHSIYAIASPMTGPISKPFHDVLLPVIYDIGNVMFVCCASSGFYSVMRKNLKGGVDRLKWSSIGFIGLRSMEVFMMILERVTEGMLHVK